MNSWTGSKAVDIRAFPGFVPGYKCTLFMGYVFMFVPGYVPPAYPVCTRVQKAEFKILPIEWTDEFNPIPVCGQIK
jgi:hypothetical protein